MVIFLIHIIFTTDKVQALYRRLTKKSSPTVVAEGASPTLQPSGIFADFKLYVAEHGGGTRIFVWRVLRLVGTLTLLGLAVATLVIDIEDGNDIVGTTKKHKKKKSQWFSKREWIAAALCMTYVRLVPSTTTGAQYRMLCLHVTYELPSSTRRCWLSYP